MKELIQSSLQNFAAGDVADNARNLFATLGYDVSRQAPFDEKTFGWFRENYFQPDTNFNAAKALADKWSYVDLLFQLSAEELRGHLLAFDTRQVDETRIESYLFFAIGLPGREYTRTALADITRELNKVFPMPCFVLFAYDDKLTLAVVNRRLHRRDESRDVLLKVTLIKDINTTQPKRSHIEILRDLALPELQRKHRFTNFVELHEAWQKTLDTKELNKRFFQELANWYFWAVQNVTFPDGVEQNAEVRHATSVIRLITRLIFVWFLREKGLVADALFSKRELNGILKKFRVASLDAKDTENFTPEGVTLNETSSAFYKAILQNLFFATLNSQMGERKFIAPGYHGRNAQHFVHNVLRYQSEFIAPETALNELFAPIPFLNGGLFECLDKEENGQRIRVDGFSDHPKNVLRVPDELFFGAEREVDLSVIYGDKKKARTKVRGLINILDNYKFTIAENTPLEEEIALDPELLGKVFENLLANYNPETKTTARKQTGSFYTPREIVNYMVDESLIAYLKAKLQTETIGFGGLNENRWHEGGSWHEGVSLRVSKGADADGELDALETALRRLFAYTETEHDFNDTETEILIKAIDECKILDPACGSGAFPMGVLHRLVFLLGKLDPRNQKWREWQKLKAIAETSAAYDIGDHHERETRLREINDIFDLNASDYGRKLFLIENCIYGVDIQPIAIQIAKLRFFISLIVDQKTNPAAPNLGVRPLPNLETKFVAANTLIGLEHLGLKPDGMDDLERQLKEVRAAHFLARTRRTKEKYRAADERLRNAIAELLKQGGINPTSADLVAAWNPYDQNASAPWFDAEWMFGLENGFDIIIGNPPYVLLQNISKSLNEIQQFKRSYVVASYKIDLYHLFIEKGLSLAKNTGLLTFITPANFLSNNYCVPLRKLLLTKSHINNITNYETEVFEASVNTLTFLARKASFKNEKISFRKASIENSQVVYKSHSATLQINFLRDENFLLIPADSEAMPILEKFLTKSELLGALATINFGMQLRDRKVFSDDVIQVPSNNPPTHFHRRCYTGRDIQRFAVTYQNRYCYFNDEARRGGCWDEEVHFAKGKLLIKQIGLYPEAGIDLLGYAVLNSAFMIVVRDKHYSTNYVLGVLNSKCSQYYWLNKFKDDRKTFPKIKGEYLKQIPIPQATDAQQAEIAALVDEILAAKRADARAATAEAERRIDELVYALYGLDAAEIALVKGKV